MDILKNLKKSIKILMLVMTILIIVCIVGIVTGTYVLSGICVAAFIVCAIIIAIDLAMQENSSSSSFNESKYMKNISSYIKTIDCVKVKELAEHFKITEGKIRHIVFECFKSNLIDGYTMNGDSVEKIGLTEEDKKTKVVKCLGCGARFSSAGRIKKCPYCGSLYD